MDYPNNSMAGINRPNPQAEKREPIKPVLAEGEAKTRKKSLTSKLVGIFVPEDVDNIKDYIIDDMIIPGIKHAILDGMSMVFFKEPYSGGYGGRKSMKGGRTSYERYYDDDRRGSSRHEMRDRSRTRDLRAYEDIDFITRAKAELALDSLFEALDRYKQVPIGAIYEAANQPNEPIDYDYGWTDLSGARVEGDSRSGYYIYIPRRPHSLR